MIDIKHILKYHAYLNVPLNYQEAYELGNYVIMGCRGDNLAQIQSIAALCALHNRALYGWRQNQEAETIHGNELPKNAADQIAGICAAVFEHDIATSEFGFVDPDTLYAMDNCGMGGDLVVTANISTIAGFIAAALDVPMCKHGSPANADEGKYGSSDFISLICGIDNFASKERVEECVKELGFGYTEACDTRYKMIHMQTHEVAQLPHMNDIIGPITNPYNPRKLTRRVLGVNHLIPPKIVAEAYQILNHEGVTSLQRGFFVRGFTDEKRQRGMDEISVCVGGTQVAELKDGEIVEYDLHACDFGVEPIAPEEVDPDGDKGHYSLRILKGEATKEQTATVLANAAVLLCLAGKSDNLEECYRMAEEALWSGKAYKKMLAVKEAVPVSSS